MLWRGAALAQPGRGNQEGEDGEQTLEGTIEHVTYQSADSGYTVARFAVDAGGTVVTVVGNLIGATTGASFKLTGRWKNHPQYGKQFQVDDFEERLPATVEGIRKYLGSGLIKGVGPVTADRIVDHFGISSLEVIDSDVERLYEVAGVGPAKVQQIVRAWQEQRHIKEIMLFLQSHDITTGLSVRIYKTYGDDSLRVVRENPYQLSRDVNAGGVFGVGFKIADQVARKLGLAADSPYRVEAGVVHVLNELASDGHTFAPQRVLVSRAVEALAVDEAAVASAEVDAAIERLASFSDPQLIIEPIALDDLPEAARAAADAADDTDAFVDADGDSVAKVVVDSNPSVATSGSLSAVYLPPLYYAELGIGRRMRRMLDDGADRLAAFKETDWDACFRWLDTVNPYPLAGRQRDAVRQALTRKICVLTGGPGTGKTTTVRSVLQLLEQREGTVLLAAPTGRAAKRLAETTGVRASTIHRLLEFKPAEGRMFQRHEDNLLNADLIVIDEMSMVDTLLMNHLIKAVDSSSHLLLVGDIDQLPSVGPGNVLRDLIGSGEVTTVALDQIFRQDARSWIAVNAARINKGLMPETPRDSLDFFLFREEDPAAAADRVVDVVAHRVPRRFGLDPINDIQVLSPMHRGAAGVASLNERLQAALNPPAANKPEVRWSGHMFRLGDRVMQIRNNYDKDVFNGDLGRIGEVDAEEQTVTVIVDERPVLYAFHEMDELMPAWAISTHKSQGGEYPCVVMAMVPQHWMMLQRNLLYTGVTRARRLCVLVGSKRAIGMAVRNDVVAARFTGLARRIRA